LCIPFRILFFPFQEYNDIRVLVVSAASSFSRLFSGEPDWAVKKAIKNKPLAGMLISVAVDYLSHVESGSR
jgi:thiamine transporter ThiT